MHEETLKEIVKELGELLPGRFLGRVFQLSPFSLAIDFGLKENGFLFINIEPVAPRLYLIKRTIRQIEKSSFPLSSFTQSVRSVLGGGIVKSLSKDENERVVRITLLVENDLGDLLAHSLIAQLTGRSANLFLLDSESRIKHAWRTPHGAGQQVGELYNPPLSGQKSYRAEGWFKNALPAKAQLQSPRLLTNIILNLRMGMSLTA